MKITDTVYMLDSTAGSYAYLILGQETMLVDTCFPGRGKKILNELASQNVNPHDLKHILLTHHDGDHIGNVAMLEQASGATVWASAEDIPYIYGQKSRPGIKKYLSFLMRVPPPTHIQPYPQDHCIGEIEVIATPGHTPGHVCLLYQDVLFAGDLLASSKGQLRHSPAWMNWNQTVLSESIKKITPLSFRWICPAHGRPVERGQQLENFV